MTAIELKKLWKEAVTAEGAQTFDRVCKMVGVGVGVVQSRDRTADVAKRRAVVAWVLNDRLKWPVSQVAQALKRTDRQIIRLVQAER